MKFKPVERLAVFYEPREGQRQRVGSLLRAQHELFFEYDAAFLEQGLELSPFHLPLREGVFRGEPTLFDGLMGLFDDSLPDGWGRLLLDRRAQQAGLSAARLGPLDRLSLIGSRAMGALAYEPEQLTEVPSIVKLKDLAAETHAVLDEAKADLERLFLIGGSPHGARPKALVQVDARGRLHAGVSRALPNCTAWLVKFPARGDGPHAGRLEHAYALMARAAGLDAPQTKVMAGHFATRRFDREGTQRVHLHTLCGLLHVPHTTPSFTYERLLMAARRLTDARGVEELFRRACFNVLAHNRDDHSKNFAFCMDARGQWTVAPAYDLTFSMGPGGEHWMTVAGEGAAPTRRHLEQLARSAGVRRAGETIDRVRAAVARFPRFADEAGVPRRVVAELALRLR